MRTNARQADHRKIGSRNGARERHVVDDVRRAPRLIIRNAARRWLTLKNFDLLFYDDRLIAAEGVTFISALGTGSSPNPRQAREAADADRVAQLLDVTDQEILRRARDNLVIRLDEITRARLTARFGI